MADPTASVLIHPSLIANTLGDRCALTTCSLERSLRTCSGCMVVHYCSDQHQDSHLSTHKSVCNNVKQSRAKLEEAEEDLRAAAPSDNLPKDVFNTAAGHFSKYTATRPLMDARFEYLNTLLAANTKTAVQLALQHSMDLLHLDRSDNLGVRDIVPALLLRLGREQECYDFIKWWATLRKRYKRLGGYDWNDQGLPYLDIKDADAFETVAELDLRRMGLSHAVALTLLKIRLRLDIAEHTATSETLTDGVHGRQVGDIIAKRMPSEDVISASKLEKGLVRQLRILYQAVHELNPYFWDQLLQTVASGEIPGYGTPGSAKEAQVVRAQNLRAWEETEDAQMLVEVEVPQHTTIEPFPSLDEPKTVMAMSWGCSSSSSSSSNGCHDGLAAAIPAKANFRNCTSLEATRGLSGNFTTMTPMLITDDGPLEDERMFENIISMILGGQTVILCGQYSKNVSDLKFRTFMKRLNLPWQKGEGEITEVGRLDAAIGMPSGFPNTYKPTAVCLKNVSTANIWYMGDTPRDAAVVLKQVSRGRLGYIGDTSGDPVSDELVLAMCGFWRETH